jgi:TonB family protein
MPIADMPIADMPIAGTPIAGMPIAGMPIADMPIAGTPIAGMPIAGMPIAGMPPTGAPSTHTSRTGTPAVYNDPEAILSAESGITPPLDGPIKAALAGDRLTLDQIYTYNKLLASSGRISKSLIASLINQGQINSKAEASQGKPAEAANILGQVLDFSHYLSSLKWGQVPWNKQIPYCWLDSWKAPGVGLELADYIAPLNDYGFFLQKSGRDEEAIPIFKAVINEDPTREVAYLNLADSLEKTGKSSDAGQYYRLYKQLMEQESKAILVPARVDVGRKKAITPEKINSDVLQYMDLVQDSIHKAWIPFKSNTSSKVVAQFHVDSEGHLKDVKIIKSSANENTDRAATDALAKVTLPKPPADIKPDADIQFSFDYNVANAPQAKIFPIDRWLRDVNTSPTPANVLPLAEALLLLHRFDDAESIVQTALQKDQNNTDLKHVLTNTAKAREEARDREASDRAFVQQVLNESALKLAGTASPMDTRSKDPQSYTEIYPEHRRYHAVGLIATNNGAWSLGIADLSRAMLTYPLCLDSKTSLSHAYNSKAIAEGRQDGKDNMHDLHCAYCIDQSGTAVEGNIFNALKRMNMDPASFDSLTAYADALAKDGDAVGAIVEYRAALKLRQDSTTIDKLAAMAAKLKAQDASKHTD